MASRRLGPLHSLAVRAIALIALTTCRPHTRSGEDAHALLAIHSEVLDAHRAGDADKWMAVEADEYISANNGTMSFPTKADRRASREPYLASTIFTAYQDTRPPAVRISADGSLGWVIAEVEVRGTQRNDDGTEHEIDAVWAWIELYQKQGDTWRLVGNISNRRQ